MSDIVTLARRHKHVAPTHYEGCEVDHIGCLVNRLADEIEGLRAQLEERYILMRVRQLEHALDAERQTVRRQRAENERLRTVYVLIASSEDKIIGCYISREAAEGVAKLLMADWRINEYALVGKP